MLLILSQAKDITALKVSKWLNHFQIPFLNIEDDISYDLFNKIELSNKSKSLFFSFKEKNYSFDEFTIVWNRRGLFNFSIPKTKTVQKNFGEKSNAFYNHLYEENKALKDYIAYRLSQKYHIDDSRLYSLNKLQVLDIATEIGLQIPETIVTNDSQNLSKQREYITKHINNIIFTDSKDSYIKQDTKLVEQETLKLENTFKYSLFQQKIEKKYEIRTFIFFDKLFSMAIFSQYNEKTKVDFRNYDTEKQNRMVPYKLPERIEQKLLKLMKKLKIQSGSADLIFDGKDYVFLEINPVGQLDFVSGNCNYQIEKHIATFIKDKYYELKNVN